MSLFDPSSTSPPPSEEVRLRRSRNAQTPHRQRRPSLYGHVLLDTQPVNEDTSIESILASLKHRNPQAQVQQLRNTMVPSPGVPQIMLLGRQNVTRDRSVEEILAAARDMRPVVQIREPVELTPIGYYAAVTPPPSPTVQALEGRNRPPPQRRQRHYSLVVGTLAADAAAEMPPIPPHPDSGYNTPPCRCRQCESNRDRDRVRQQATEVIGEPATPTSGDPWSSQASSKYFTPMFEALRRDFQAEGLSSFDETFEWLSK
jgi:hypothetical protein